MILLLWLFMQTAEAATSRTALASALTTVSKGLTGKAGVLLIKNDSNELCASEATGLWSCTNKVSGAVISKNETSSHLAGRWGYQ